MAIARTANAARRAPVLLLFDIDGTLLSIAQRELNVFGRALKSAFGTAGPIDDYSFAGKTDHQIAFDLLTRAGKNATEIEAGLPEMKTVYFEMLDDMLEMSSMRILPGALELLDELSREPAVVLGLQTGNWEVAADIKLSRFGLDRYFDVGAFGDGHLDRSELPLVARERAEQRTGWSFHSRHTLVIGDTALDVACARSWAMPSLGVATGSASQVELEAAGADSVIPTLADLDARALLDLLLEEPP